MVANVSRYERGARLKIGGRWFLGGCDASYWSGAFYVAPEGDCEDTD